MLFQKTPHRIIACIAVVACLLLEGFGAPKAQAFSLLDFREFSNPSRWSEESLAGGLTYSISYGFLSGASGDAAGAVRNAFDTWAAASTQLMFTEASFSAFGPYGGANIDVWSAPSTFKYGSLAFNGALALAVVGVSGDRIVGADLFFNEGYAFSTNPGFNQFDVESIALHEIGHTLGLDHPDEAADMGVNYDATGALIPATGLEVMNSTIAYGEISRVLTADDLAGISYLYPSLEVAFTSSTVTAPLTSEVPEPPLWLLAFLGLAGLTLWLRIRVRPRAPAES